jgi:uncharacterized DUF497 family protein
MLDLSIVTGFDWDAGNAQKNARHGVSQAEAEQVFFDVDVLLTPDIKHSGAEPRFQALGITEDGRTLQVTFTLRGKGTLVRVISARDMSRKERKIYEIQT